jgi:hypothetical protein
VNVSKILFKWLKRFAEAPLYVDEGAGGPSYEPTKWFRSCMLTAAPSLTGAVKVSSTVTTRTYPLIGNEVPGPFEYPLIQRPPVPHRGEQRTQP